MASAISKLNLSRGRPRPLWLDIAMETVILLSVYAIYSMSRGSIDAKSATAFDHARHLIDLEKTLGIFAEKDIQSFFLETSWLTHFANVLYTICYYPAVIGFAVWAYWRHRPKYRFIRTVFIISAALAFIVFALYPMAPPRFFDGQEPGAPNLGFVDTIAEHWHVNESTDQSSYNPFAAMPSLHQGWTLMIGVGIIWMNRSRLAKAIGILLPIAMFIGITATANHFILDAVGGAIVIAIAFGLAALVFKWLGKPIPREEPPRETQPSTDA